MAPQRGVGVLPTPHLPASPQRILAQSGSRHHHTDMTQTLTIFRYCKVLQYYGNQVLYTKLLFARGRHHHTDMTQTQQMTQQTVHVCMRMFWRIERKLKTWRVGGGHGGTDLRRR
jgi:hypothetical protein